MADAAIEDLHILDADSSMLGPPAPPTRAHLKLIRGPYHWTLLLRTQKPNRDDVAAWLKPLDPALPDRVLIPSDPRVLRVTLRRLPPALDEFNRSGRIDHMIAEPDGRLTIWFDGPLEPARAILAKERPREPPARPFFRPVLTPRQHEALAIAVRRGYYDLPRRLNLRMLSKDLNMSAAALSELLRRAEGHLVKKYVDETTSTAPRPKANGAQPAVAKEEKRPTSKVGV